jgi:WD40 repeat protein
MRRLAVLSVLAGLAIQCGPRQGESEDATSPRVVKVPTAPGSDETKQNGPLAIAQVGHSSDIWALAWSPKGDRIATGSFDHSIRIWTDRGRMLGMLRGHREAITELAFSPRGDLLASADRHARVRLWDLHHAGRYVELEKAGDHLAFNPDGSRIVVVGFDLTARVFDTKTGKQVQTFHLDRGRQLRSVAWSRDGHRIAACSLDGPLGIWDADSDAQSPSVSSMCAGGALQELRYAPDGRIASAGNRLIVLEPDGKTSRTLERQGIQPYQLVLGSDGKKIFSNGSAGQAHVWDVASARYERSISHPGYLNALAVSPSGDRIALGGKMPVKSPDGGTVEIPVARIYDVKTGKMRAHLEGVARPVTCASWNPSGDTLLTCSPELVTWDARTGKRKLVLYPPGAVGSEWNPKLPMLAILGRRSVRVLDTTSGKELGKFTGDEPTMVWSPDGTTLAITSSSSVTLWDTRTRKTTQVRIQSARPYVRHVAFSADSKDVILAMGDGLDAYSAANGRRVKSFSLKGRVPSWRNPEHMSVGPTGTVAVTLNGPGAALFDEDGHFLQLLEDRAWFAQPSFSPDGTRVAYGTKDDIRIWGARDNVRYTGHDDVLRTVAWSNQGDRFASSSDDGTVRLWKPGRAEPLHTFSGYEGRVWTVAWHASDKALLGQANEAMIHRLKDAETLHVLVGPGATTAAWYTDSGSYAGDEKALEHAFLRPSDDLLEASLAKRESSWISRPELLSDLE